MINSSKRYSIRVNGIQVMQYDSIQKNYEILQDFIKCVV